MIHHSRRPSDLFNDGLLCLYHLRFFVIRYIFSYLSYTCHPKSIHIHINICITIDYEKNKFPHVPINKPLPALSAQGYFTK